MSIDVGVIRADWFTQRHWAALPDQERIDIVAAIPERHYLTMTHGGRTFTVALRAEDGEEIDLHRAFTLRTAIDGLLSCQFGTSVTLDGKGYVVDFEP